MVKIKFCGMQRAEDILFASECRPDYIGYIFAPSKRQIPLEKAAELNRLRDPSIRSVGVFVNETPEKILQAVEQVSLDAIQLHGEESPSSVALLKRLLPQTEIWKALRVKGPDSLLSAREYPADCFLLDSFSRKAYGGTGKKGDWEFLKQYRHQLPHPFFLAGGLHIENISEAIEKIEPFGVDISSGIEENETKNLKKMRQITEILKR